MRGGCVYATSIQGKELSGGLPFPDLQIRSGDAARDDRLRLLTFSSISRNYQPTAAAYDPQPSQLFSLVVCLQAEDKIFHWPRESKQLLTAHADEWL